MQSTAVTEALMQVRAGLDALLSADRTGCDGVTLLAETAELEELSRRLAAVRAVQLVEVDERGVAIECGYTSTTALLVDHLHLNIGEARAHVQRARELAPRRSLVGATLPPVFAATAVALAEGRLSVGHASVISAYLPRIPTTVEVDHPNVIAQAEALLVEQAATMTPRSLATVAERLLAFLDPNGVPPCDDERRRRRFVSITKHADGTFRLAGEVTNEWAATWRPIIDTLGRPLPADDGVADDRTAGQRHHDAMLEAGRRLLRSGSLPDAGGTPVTMLVRIDEKDLRTSSGCGVTDDGDPIPVADVLRASGDAELAPVVLDTNGGVVSFGRARRVASVGQRRALAVRDKGCTFPGCTRPAAWCQTNHIVRWENGGLTDLTNLHLLCAYHHREYERRGWQPRIRDGCTEWIPPAWYDPRRRPVRNTAHHVPEFDFAG